MINVSQLQNKRIVVLGLGLTGMSFVRFLSAQGFDFAIMDSRENVVDKHSFTDLYPTAQLIQGAWERNIIGQAEILLVSPGIDLNADEINTAISTECQVWGDVELYCRLTQTPTVAVTGSNGKSTVVSLLNHIGQKLGYKTQLGGNVGVPVLDTIDETPELLILELSSFQLESMSSMQAIAAAMLNLSDDHLDRHLTLDNYGAIKRRIYQQCDTAVFNRDDKHTFVDQTDSTPQKVISIGSDKPANETFGLDNNQGEVWLFYGSTPLIALHQLPIAGIHNALNCLAALALGQSAGWKLEEMVNVLPSFTGLPHRCQVISSNDEVIWINDSKATNVGACIAAINGLAPSMKTTQQLILIAGGEGKGADFSPLKQPFSEHVDQLITLGKDGQAIADLHGCSEYVSTMEQAVERARQSAKSGDIVLLSPACASIDMYKNFIERGEAFVKAVQIYREAS